MVRARSEHAPQMILVRAPQMFHADVFVAANSGASGENAQRASQAQWQLQNTVLWPLQYLCAQ